jgi:hypothetical protein
MLGKIPAEELRRVEAKCNALLALEEDYSHLLHSLEMQYKIRVREKRIRRIVGGSARPEEILLEEDVVIGRPAAKATCTHFAVMQQPDMNGV